MFWLRSCSRRPAELRGDRQAVWRARRRSRAAGVAVTCALACPARSARASASAPAVSMVGASRPRPRDPAASAPAVTGISASESASRCRSAFAAASTAVFPASTNRVRGRVGGRRGVHGDVGVRAVPLELVERGGDQGGVGVEQRPAHVRVRGDLDETDCPRLRPAAGHVGGRGDRQGSAAGERVEVHVRRRGRLDRQGRVDAPAGNHLRRGRPPPSRRCAWTGRT